MIYLLRHGGKTTQALKEWSISPEARATVLTQTPTRATHHEL